MLVFELKCKVRLKEFLPYEEMAEKFAYYIDSALGKEQKYLEFHQSAEYKYYCYDLPYPCEKNKIYQSGKLYTVRIRTVKPDLADYFSKMLPFHETRELQGMGGELRLLQQKMLEKVWTLTPLIMKNDFGYWREHISLPEFEDRLKINLIKKYNHFTGEKIDEDFHLYELLEFKNNKPIKTYYKGICLLGDKINFVAAKNKTAQDLWFFALGTGLLENNSRGAGFLNYRYL